MAIKINDKLTRLRVKKLKIKVFLKSIRKIIRLL